MLSKKAKNNIFITGIIIGLWLVLFGFGILNKWFLLSGMGIIMTAIVLGLW